MRRAFLASIPVTLAAVGINLAYKAILAHRIPKAELALFFTTVDILSFVMLLLIGFRSAMVVAYEQTGDEGGIVNTLRLFVAGAALLALGLVVPYVHYGLGTPVPVWELVALIASYSYYIYLSNQLSMYRLYTLINGTTLLEPLFVLVWFLLVYRAGMAATETLMLSAVAGNMTLCGIVWGVKRRRHPEPAWRRPGAGGHNTVFVKNSLIASAEFAVGMGATVLAVFFMVSYATPHELADFQVVAKSVFMYLIMLFVFPIFKFILPHLARLAADKDREGLRKEGRWIIGYALAVQTVVAGIFWGEGDRILAAIFPPQYAKALPMTLILSLSIGAAILNGYYIAVLRSFGKFWLTFAIRLSGTVGFLIFFGVLKSFLIPVWAIVWSLSLSYLPMGIISAVMAQKLLHSRTLTAVDPALDK